MNSPKNLILWDLRPKTLILWDLRPEALILWDLRPKTLILRDLTPKTLNLWDLRLKSLQYGFEDSGKFHRTTRGSLYSETADAPKTQVRKYSSCGIWWIIPHLRSFLGFFSFLFFCLLVPSLSFLSLSLPEKVSAAQLTSPPLSSYVLFHTILFYHALFSSPLLSLLLSSTPPYLLLPLYP